MSLYQALILGAVQGLTEFLPISSSGHLALLHHLNNFQQSTVTFTILVHTATLISIIIFFSKDIRHLNRQMIRLLVIGSIPIFVVGLIAFQFIDQIFSSLLVISLGFLISAIILFSTKLIHYQQNQKKLTSKFAFIVGIAQSIAILPGVSRSGLTVSTGLHLQIQRQAAFTFSFLLSIPAILAALTLEIIDLGTAFIITSANLAGMFAAFIFGLLALYLLKYLTYKSKLHYFGFYCLALSCFSLFLYLSG